MFPNSTSCPALQAKEKYASVGAAAGPRDLCEREVPGQHFELCQQDSASSERIGKLSKKVLKWLKFESPTPGRCLQVASFVPVPDDEKMVHV